MFFGGGDPIKNVRFNKKKRPMIFFLRFIIVGTLTWLIVICCNLVVIIYTWTALYSSSISVMISIKKKNQIRIAKIWTKVYNLFFFVYKIISSRQVNAVSRVGESWKNREYKKKISGFFKPNIILHVSNTFCKDWWNYVKLQKQKQFHILLYFVVFWQKKK